MAAVFRKLLPLGAVAIGACNGADTSSGPLANDAGGADAKSADATASNPPDSSTVTDAGTVLGTCDSNDAACPSGSRCFFAIGSCAVTGECIEVSSSGGTCGLVEELCGCDGGPAATTGCGFPNGYASAPNTGGQDCSLPNQLPHDAG